MLLQVAAVLILRVPLFQSCPALIDAGRAQAIVVGLGTAPGQIPAKLTCLAGSTSHLVVNAAARIVLVAQAVGARNPALVVRQLRGVPVRPRHLLSRVKLRPRSSPAHINRLAWVSQDRFQVLPAIRG